MTMDIERRKSEHIDICLEQEVNGAGITTGLEQYHFIHNALPELNYADIDTSTTLFGKALRVPFLISSMTGGTARAYEINLKLASAAQAQGWAIGLGSTRAAVERPELAYSFQIRSAAPDIPIIANIGAVQLNYGFGIEACRKVVELVEADALVLHLNSLQEVLQVDGDTNFSGLLDKVGQLCRSLEVPVGVKEVGWGMNAQTAQQLGDAGVGFLDVAGAGGTSWSQVEKFRSSSPLLTAAAQTFAGWGIQTSESIRLVTDVVTGIPVFASGGVTNGLEAAKSIALGADFAGFGRSLLEAGASDEPDVLMFQLQQIELELRVAMFGIGASNLSELKRSKALRRKM